jgi:hypothetical protein
MIAVVSSWMKSRLNIAEFVIPSVTLNYAVSPASSWLLVFLTGNCYG